MGRTKSIAVKRISDELIKRHSDSLSDDFEKNKTAVNRLVLVQSKKLRNTMAGYLTRLMKKPRMQKSTCL